ncbi:MAG: agmatinase [Bacteroidetes bacterium]|nr:agmatinase [Bacteroidota bacterium]
METTNYGGIPGEFSEFRNAAIVILPVPYDATSSWIKGAAKGPRAILEASANMELYDIETDSQVYLRGIHTCEPVTENKSPEAIVAAVEKKVVELLGAGKFVVTIGGNHTVSIGAIKAFASMYPGLTILHLDAHADLRQSYDGSENNHACVMARARELCPVVQAGIRSLCKEELEFADTERIIFAHDIPYNPGWPDKVLKLLSKKVYITIDLDVFDPAYLPSTGTPEPGGPDYYQVLHLLKQVNRHSEIVGFDVVELCPNETEKSSDFLASKLIYQLLSYRFEG